MAPKVLLEEFHLSLYVMSDLKPPITRSIRHTFNQKSFQRRLRNALQQVLRHYPALQEVQCRLSR